MKSLVSFLFFALIILVACGGSPTEASIATAVASTMEAQVIQTAVIATRRAQDTPTPEPQVICSIEAQDYLNALDDLEDRWFDAFDIANSTARMNLAGPVSELQVLRHELDGLEGPGCASESGMMLYNHMDSIIDGFLLFMQQESEEDVDAAFERASNMLDRYYVERGILYTEAVAATRKASEATK